MPEELQRLAGASWLTPISLGSRLWPLDRGGRQSFPPMVTQSDVTRRSDVYPEYLMVSRGEWLHAALLPGPQAARAIHELDGRSDVLPISHFVVEPDRVALVHFRRLRDISRNGHHRAVVQHHLIPLQAHDPAFDHPRTLRAGRLRHGQEPCPGTTGRDQRECDYQSSHHWTDLPTGIFSPKPSPLLTISQPCAEYSPHPALSPNGGEGSKLSTKRFFHPSPPSRRRG